MKKYIDIHKKKYNLYQSRCVSNENDNQYLICKPILYLDYSDIIINNQPSFSKKLEMRITFISSFRHMTNDYYLKQPLPIREIKLNQLPHKNPQVISCLKRFCNYPFVQEYVHIPVLAKNFPQLHEFEHEYLNLSHTVFEKSNFWIFKFLFIFILVFVIINERLLLWYMLWNN